MSTRTYTRTYESEVRHTFTLTDADLTVDDQNALARWDAGDVSAGKAIDAIFERFDPDHEDVVLCDDSNGPLIARER
ncbi:hypothetical protein BH708_03135 [Brachybacterium sp. P6-10-X1]|uniref:hypothetical protein n=1 Tax=Brachybacterium sp. P6-10-X1 TaxID=1903186 RepID=UPI000971BEAE|nr:hypothetical protein [Brachybacterium sp. P6-10-X1]APX31883.1 hypothetical protein BH708_03135 [Brachybacterium sp. P6-10-X1]